MTWFRISFDHAKTHAVSGELSLHLLHEMIVERGHPLEDLDKKYPGHALGDNPKFITEWAIDHGGVWARDQPLDTLHVDGLEIEIASDNVGLTLAQVNALKPRTFTDGVEYYKLHHWHFCLVLTPDQFHSLQGQLARLEPAATAKADAWFAEKFKKPLTPTPAVAIKDP